MKEYHIKLSETGLYVCQIENLAQFLDFKRNFHFKHVLEPNDFGNLDHELFSVKGEYDDCESKKNKYVEGLNRLGVSHILETDERISCYWEIRYEAKHGLKVDRLRQEIELGE